MGRRDVIDRGKQRNRKYIIDARGTLVEVPYSQWKREVVTNPGGPTASRAKRDKDPDLNKVTIDVVRVKHGEKAGTGEPSKVPLPQAKPTRETGLKGAFTKDALKRLLFREASEGKGFKKETIKPLKEEDKDGEKSKKDSKKE